MSHAHQERSIGGGGCSLVVVVVVMMVLTKCEFADEQGSEDTAGGGEGLVCACLIQQFWGAVARTQYLLCRG